MNKYEVDIEELNYEYNIVAGGLAPQAIVDIIVIFNKMVEEAYQKRLREAQLEPDDFLFPVKSVKSA